MASGQEDLDASNVLHVKSCPYLPGTANRYSISSRSSRLSLKNNDNQGNLDNDNNSESNSTLNGNNVNHESKAGIDLNINASSLAMNKTAYRFPSSPPHQLQQHPVGEQFNDFEAHHHPNSIEGYNKKTSNEEDALYDNPSHYRHLPATASLSLWHETYHPHIMQLETRHKRLEHPFSSSSGRESASSCSSSLQDFDSVQGRIRKRTGSFKQRIHAALPVTSFCSRGSPPAEDHEHPGNNKRRRSRETGIGSLRCPSSSSLVISMTSHACCPTSSSSSSTVPMNSFASPSLVVSVSEGTQGRNLRRQAWMTSQEEPLASSSQNNIDFDCDYTSQFADNDINSPFNALLLNDDNEDDTKKQKNINKKNVTSVSGSTSGVNNNKNNNNNNLNNNKNNTASNNMNASDGNRIQITC